jgi:glycosyltransferase involved in cell wall biosynthesis
MTEKAHILILVENLSVPFDRRVWQESETLKAHGFRVSVICPQGQGRDQNREEWINGIRILRYRLKAATGGPAGYIQEYGQALWQTLLLALKVNRECRVDVVHACNPPDILFLVAVILRPWGARFVFDHHDLVPELFQSRFSGGKKFVYWLTLLAERITLATADGVISTNESYRGIAIKRGKCKPERISVVRSAPDLKRFTQKSPDVELRNGKRYLLAYLGVMGPQDGVDYALRSIQILKKEFGRSDFHCVLMGSGDCHEEMVQLSRSLGIEDVVSMPGRVPDEFVQRCLCTADVCLSPDPLNPLNDVSTMNKVVEYMAMAKPIVSFDLTEARVSAGDAAIYVKANDEYEFAKGIHHLLNDPEARQRMGQLGQARVRGELSWEQSSKNLIEFYENLLIRTGKAG